MLDHTVVLVQGGSSVGGFRVLGLVCCCAADCGPGCLKPCVLHVCFLVTPELLHESCVSFDVSVPVLSPRTSVYVFGVSFRLFSSPCVISVWFCVFCGTMCWSDSPLVQHPKVMNGFTTRALVFGVLRRVCN